MRKSLFIILIVLALALTACSPYPTSGYVTYMFHDPGHYEDVCTSSNGHMCFSYRKEWIDDTYRIDISSCDLPTVRAGGFGATFCEYNILYVSTSQYSRAQLGKYFDLSKSGGGS